MSILKLLNISSKTSNILLLISIFMMIFCVPLTAENDQHELYLRLNFSLLLICSLLVVDKINNAAIIVVLFMIAGQWISDLVDWEVASTALRIIIITAFFYTAVNLILQIIRVKSISSVVILEAINGYLLLGLFFSLLVQFIVAIDPNAYHIAPEADNAVGNIFNQGDNIYYAYSTLTTVGYGDIAPLSPLARSLSIVISVSGQIYLTTILAIIVGKYANLKQDEA